MDDTPGALLDRARAEYAAGSATDALTTCTLLLERCTPTTDPRLVADAATVVRRPVDPVLRGRAHLLAGQALALLRAGRDEDASSVARVSTQLEVTRDVLREPIEVATPPDDPDHAFARLEGQVEELRDPSAWPRRLTLARDAIALGRATGRLDFEAWGHAWAMDVFATTGRRPELFGHLTALLPLAEQLGAVWQERVVLVRASQALIDGRLGEVVPLADEARRLTGDRGDAAFLHLSFTFEVARLRGDVEPLLPAVREVVDGLPFLARTWLCAALMSTGRREEVVEEWRALAPHVVAMPSEAPELLMALVDGARVSVWTSDEESSTRLHDRLLPYQGLHAIPGASTPYVGAVDLALGQLARFLGRREEAARHLRAALQAAEEMHALPQKAAVLTELAALEPPHSRMQREHVEAGLQLARRLGLHPTQADLEALGQPAAGDPALTPREGEVAASVAQGLTNAAIARQLTLSPRTVENHLSRMLLKLGLRSRTALALWVQARGTPEAQEPNDGAGPSS